MPAPANTVSTRVLQILNGHGRYEPKLRFVGQDGYAVPTKRETRTPLEPPASVQHPLFDELTSLIETLTTEQKLQALVALKRTASHASPHHELFGYVFLYLLSTDQGRPAVEWFFGQFHFCRSCYLALSDLIQYLPLCGLKLAEDTLEAIGEHHHALLKHPEVDRWWHMSHRQREKIWKQDPMDVTGMIPPTGLLVQPTIAELIKKKWAIARAGGTRRSVAVRLASLGYSSDLCDAWRRFELDWRAARDPFAHKAALGLLRSFLEALAAETAHRLVGGFETDRNERPSAVRKLLARPDVGALTEPQVRVLAFVYGKLSEVGVHSLTATPDEAISCKNLGEEMAIMLTDGFERASLNKTSDG